MGYDLHITRAEEWTESENAPITFEEWLAHTKEDLELYEGGYVDRLTNLDNPDIVKRTPLFGWRRGPNPSDDDPCLEWYKGRVDVKNPDEQTIKKMLRIARVFSARLIGDDGETYSLSILGKVKYSHAE